MTVEADISPRETIYVNNLNERINKEELKKSLYAAFSQFGPILDVVALKTFRMRGQAFVVFRDISSATNAVRQMQGFPFYDKPMKLDYAKAKSDATAKLDGSYLAKVREERTAKRRAEREERKAGAKKVGYGHSSGPDVCKAVREAAARVPKKHPRRKEIEEKAGERRLNPYEQAGQRQDTMSYKGL